MLLIDANNYIKRIYHSGQDPYELFLDLLHKYSSETIEVVCDTASSRLARRAIYPDYKKGRKFGDDPVFFTIYDNIIAIARHFKNVKVIEVIEAEADDYIMSVANSGDIVISNDKDLWPLVDKGVKILIAGSTMVDTQLIETKFHHPDPGLIYIYKSLVGDPSDRIKGKVRFGIAAYKKLSTDDLYYIKGRLEGVEATNPELDKLADDESVRLSWKLVNQLSTKIGILQSINTPLQDFLDEKGITLLENM